MEDTANTKISYIFIPPVWLAQIRGTDIKTAGRKLCRLFYKYSISHFLITIDFAKYLWYTMGIGGKCHETD